eukprot:3631296-Rhodomonas_salina.1
MNSVSFCPGGKLISALSAPRNASVELLSINAPAISLFPSRFQIKPGEAVKIGASATTNRSRSAWPTQVRTTRSCPKSTTGTMTRSTTKFPLTPEKIVTKRL